MKKGGEMVMTASMVCAMDKELPTFVTLTVSLCDEFAEV